MRSYPKHIIFCLFFAQNLTEVTLATSHYPHGVVFWVGFLVCGVGVFFILSPGRSIHNLRSVLYTEISSVFPFQSSAQLTPDANKCRHANAYFNDRAKPFNPEPSMAPLWTLPASSQLQKRFWLLVVSFFPPPGSRSSNACSHAHPLHYMGKTELSMADLNLPR